MKKWGLIALALVLISLVAGGYYVYRQAVGFVRQEIEETRDRVAAKNDGSVVEWRDYHVEGLSLVFKDFHYFDAADGLDFFAKNFRVSGRGEHDYDVLIEGAEIALGRYDAFEFASLKLDGYNNPRDLADLAFDQADIAQFEWRVEGQDEMLLTVDALGVSEFDALQFARFNAENLTLDLPRTHWEISSPLLHAEDLKMLINDQDVIWGALYEMLELQDFSAIWHGEEILKGGLVSNGQFDDKENLLRSGDFSLQIDLDLASESFAEHYLSGEEIAPNTKRFFNGLGVERYRGEWALNADLKEDGQANLQNNIALEGLAEMKMDARFAGYQTQILRDLNINQGFFDEANNLPESFSDFEFLGADVIYQDEILAKNLIENFLNFDPALASFMAQMTLPRFLPNDRSLVREASDALAGFLRAPERFEIHLQPPSPVPASEMVELYQNQGPYKERLGVSIQTNFEE